MDELKNAGIAYVGCFDGDIDLFESQYAVPDGVTYNSYIIFDEKIAVMDTCDRRRLAEWMDNVTNALNGKAPDLLIIHHMEPDHSAGIRLLAERYPEMLLVGNAKTFKILQQFTGCDYAGRILTVAEGDSLSLGRRSLTFYMAPMVHWPEVMASYLSGDGVLFSADGFGRFGSPDPAAPWVDEARRYYINIVGKYGAQTKALIAKAAGLDIRAICPLHGPALTGDAITLALEKYGVWDSYVPEEKGVVVAYASIHGNTAAAAQAMAEQLRTAGIKAEAWDLTRQDWAGAVAAAFRYSGMLLLASSYNGGVFTPMAQYLYRLQALGYRDRVVGMVENGSWGPTAAKTMRGFLDGMKGLTVLEPAVTILSAPTDAVKAQMAQLCTALAEQV